MKYKLVVFVPIENADKVRNALGNSGAGRIGNYSHCSFSSRGFGRFLPKEGASPNIGEVGRLESVKEERVEVVVEDKYFEKVIEEMKKVHPYEEVAYDVYRLEDL